MGLLLIRSLLTSATVQEIVYDISGYYIWQREVNTVFFFWGGGSRDGKLIVDIVLDKFIVPYGAVLPADFGYALPILYVLKWD